MRPFAQAGVPELRFQMLLLDDRDALELIATFVIADRASGGLRPVQADLESPAGRIRKRLRPRAPQTRSNGLAPASPAGFCRAGRLYVEPSAAHIAASARRRLVERVRTAAPGHRGPER